MSAQDDLQVSNVFQLYGHDKGCKMVELHHGTFKGYQLDVYKSLIYKKIGNNVENYLKQDRKNAKKVREIVEDGQVTSGYYLMKPVKAGTNRYILFKKGENQSGTVIYIEGSLSPEQLMDLCTIRKK
ncbi:MAG: hypothetical protein KAZ28_07395 [Bacteroidaceae bacterium]|nr:hypothetical protein [Bacteroidaceae bacterium]